jgi:tRNA-Thr(GGU) m(6)t(6)A37 methyltransferase TsaA
LQRDDMKAQSGIASIPYRLLVFTCYGGCATGVAASRACIRIWEENPGDIKIGCLPAVIVPWKLKEITGKSEKRILVDACGVQCGAKLIEREGMTVDHYIELTSLLGIRKEKKLPSKDLEDRVYRTIKREVDALLAKKGDGEVGSPEQVQKSKSLPEMLLKPVGVVKSEVEQPSLVAESGDLEWHPREGQREWRTRVSELVIDSSLAGILDGIEDFSHLLVLYWAHLVPPEGRSIIKAHPMGRKELPLVGIFATCSPARPNNICTTIVRLLQRNKNVLKVEGLDALDGSPILDIKPYNPSYYATGDVKVADWMERIHREFAEGLITGGDGEETW